MKIYQVVTPVGFSVSVPKRIWRAWPKGHRRVASISPLRYYHERRLERTFSADFLTEADLLSEAEKRAIMNEHAA